MLQTCYVLRRMMITKKSLIFEITNNHSLKKYSILVVDLHQSSIYEIVSVNSIIG